MKCSKCGKIKERGDFEKDRTKSSGFHSQCKPCRKKRASRTSGTVENFMRQSWDNINQRTVNGTHARPDNSRYDCYFKNNIHVTMSRSEFKKFCKSHKGLIESIYSKGEVPSVDRIDSRGHYSIDNIKIITLSENSRKANKGVSK